MNVNQLPFAERIPALMKLGIITDVCQIVSSSGIRPVVVININGFKLPFYRSANGTGGKEKGAWHVCFGFGKHRVNTNGFDWLAKGHLDTEVNVDYNSPAIKYYRQLLNSTLCWSHDLDLTGKNQYFVPYITFSGSRAEFNKMVFGIEDRGIISGYSAEGIIKADVANADAAFKKSKNK